MKSKLLLPVILIAGFMLVSLTLNQVNGQTQQNKQVKQETVKYTCPEHPEVVQDKPGKCPKCGMTLVEKKDKSKGTMNQTCDSTKMKSDNKTMMHDSTSMKKVQMMNDTTSMNHDKMKK